MDIDITFPGGKRVDAHIGSHIIRTDQPKEAGGDDSAPGPFDLFLAALGTCAGIYVLGFCQARGLATDGLALRQHIDVDPETHLPRKVRIEVRLPRSFPAKYRTAVQRAAEGCKVKKTIAAGPIVEVALASEDALEHTVEV
jgi:ribosomal protein S12 methylthiotransferase accessory factor